MDSTLGSFEEAVLMAVYANGDNAYGATIYTKLEEWKQSSLSMGAIYKTLGRLEAKGYLDPKEGPPEPKRRGRRKKFYRLTGTGITALNGVRAMRRRMDTSLGLSGGGLALNAWQWGRLAGVWCE
ncbi:PadR family transcriptional regulator [Acanthopleuribacter pedis]